jgi:integrase
MPRASSAPKRFTADFIRKLTVPKGKKDVVVFEGNSSGLGVRKQASGITSFVIQIKLPGNRRWRETLGRLPSLSLADARRALQVRTGDIAVGLDPFEEREAAAAEREAKRKAAEEQAKAKEADQFTLRMLLRKWSHLALDNRRKSYSERAQKAIFLTFPALIDTPVSAIDRDAVEAAVNTAADARGPGAAISAASAMRTLYRWARKRRLVADDIMLGFPMPERGKPRERTLNEDECRRVFRAAGVIGYPGGSFVQLLLLTGARRDEMRKLCRSEIVEDEVEGAVIALPAERTKQGRTSGGHRIHLSPAALGVIADCPVHQGCPFVFTNDGMKAQGDVTRLKARLDALLAKDGGPTIAEEAQRARSALAIKPPAL